MSRTWCPVPSAQYPVFSPQCLILGVQYLVHSTQCPEPGVQYPVPGVQDPVPSTQCPVTITQSPVLAPEWVLAQAGIRLPTLTPGPPSSSSRLLPTYPTRCPDACCWSAASLGPGGYSQPPGPTQPRGASAWRPPCSALSSIIPHGPSTVGSQAPAPLRRLTSLCVEAF